MKVRINITATFTIPSLHMPPVFPCSYDFVVLKIFASVLLGINRKMGIDCGVSAIPLINQRPYT
jgi:hypothetical protein